MDVVLNNADTTLGEGECFSVGALLERRPTGSHYVAAGDPFCYELVCVDFRELLVRSPRFLGFATDYLTSLLRESRRLIRMHFSSAIEVFFIRMLRPKNELSFADSPRAHNRINPGSLNEVDCRILRESFRKARTL
jgi:signal-transduction protein with cAMP-binding, CBS, and nucleotidyltransferase domain